MKKIAAALLVMSLSHGALSAEASQVNDNSHNIKQDFKETMQVVKTAIDNHQYSSPDQVPAFQEFKTRYSENELQNLHKNLKVNRRADVVNKLKNITVEKNQTKTVLLDDGSLIISRNETGPVNDFNNTNSDISTYAVKIYKGVNGGTYYSNVYDEMWGLYKTSEFWNKVNFKLYRSYADITSTSASGTYAIIPAQIDVTGSSITGDKTREATSTFDYKYQAGVSGYPIEQKYLSLSNTIKVISNVGDNINYTTYSKVSGK